MKKHLVWSNNDGNDSFEVEGNTFEEVLINALSELGWSVSEKPIQEEDEDEFGFNDYDDDYNEEDFSDFNEYDY